MKTVRTSDLIGAALDWAVAQVDGVNTIMLSPRSGQPKKPFALFGSLAISVGGDEQSSYAPSTCWHCGGPLIREHIGSLVNQGERWAVYTRKPVFAGIGETPLIAVCRAIVAANLGDEVNIPAELLP